MYDLACPSHGEADHTVAASAPSGSLGAPDWPFGRGHEPPPLTCTLAQDELLFRKGEEKKHLYRVETGAICLFDPQWDGHRAVIEFAMPGDFVGLGFLDHHVWCARAVTETTVTCLPLAAMHSLVQGNAAAEAKLAQAIEREFEQRKASLVEAGRQRPVDRVAAFLVSVSRQHRREGRDPTVISESWPCATVAGYLNLSVEALAVALADLKARGLVAPHAPDGLRLNDIEALEDIALGLSPPGPVETTVLDEVSDEVRAPPRVYRTAGGSTPAERDVETSGTFQLTDEGAREHNPVMGPVTGRRRSEGDRGSARAPQPVLAFPPKASGRSA